MARKHLQQCVEDDTSCPIPSCPSADVQMSFLDLCNHFITSHGIPLAGKRRVSAGLLVAITNHQDLMASVKAALAVSKRKYPLAQSNALCTVSKSSGQRSGTCQEEKEDIA
jgi:hypothetical protein